MEIQEQPASEELRGWALEWRNTRMGGFTMSIVVCLTCKQILQPTRKRRSERGTHGEDFYLHPMGHDVQTCTLFSSNSGRRTISSTPSFPQKLKKFLEVEWVFKGNLPYDEEIERMLS
ncbi:MAG: hypothetical protein QXZ71_04640 [Candidatus Caldarchaeum sp.]